MPLHLAAQVANNVATVKCLMKAGADIHAKGWVCPEYYVSHFIDIMCVINDSTIKLLYIGLPNNLIIPK